MNIKNKFSLFLLFLISSTSLFSMNDRDAKIISTLQETLTDNAPDQDEIIGNFITSLTIFCTENPLTKTDRTALVNGIDTISLVSTLNIELKPNITTNDKKPRIIFNNWVKSNNQYFTLEFLNATTEFRKTYFGEIDLLDLPPEILHQIFSHLKLNDLNKACILSKDTYSAIDTFLFNNPRVLLPRINEIYSIENIFNEMQKKNSQLATLIEIYNNGEGFKKYALLSPEFKHNKQDLLSIFGQLLENKKINKINDILSFMLSSKKLINFKNVEKKNYLTRAIENGYWELAELLALTECNIQPKVIMYKDANNNTALILAVKNAKIALACKLIENRADLNETNKDEENILSILLSSAFNRIDESDLNRLLTLIFERNNHEAFNEKLLSLIVKKITNDENIETFIDNNELTNEQLNFLLYVNFKKNTWSRLGDPNIIINNITEPYDYVIQAAIAYKKDTELIKNLIDKRIETLLARDDKASIYTMIGDLFFTAIECNFELEIIKLIQSYEEYFNPFYLNQHEQNALHLYIDKKGGLDHLKIKDLLNLELDPKQEDINGKSSIEYLLERFVHQESNIPNENDEEDGYSHIIINPELYSILITLLYNKETQNLDQKTEEILRRASDSCKYVILHYSKNHISIKANHFVVKGSVKKLINNLINIIEFNSNNVTDEFGYTPAENAIINQNIKLLNILLPYINVNQQNIHGDTIAHKAATKKDPQYINLILDLNKIDLSITNKNRKTALDIAKSCRYLETANAICAKLDISLLTEEDLKPQVETKNTDIKPNNEYNTKSGTTENSNNTPDNPKDSLTNPQPNEEINSTKTNKKGNAIITMLKNNKHILIPTVIAIPLLYYLLSSLFSQDNKIIPEEVIPHDLKKA